MAQNLLTFSAVKLPYSFGRYTLVEKIADGGTAEVYRAVLSGDQGFSKNVAIKRLLPSWCDTAEARQMLVDEARILSYLAHPSIVQVFELGHLEGMPFMAMEFVDGINCALLLKHLISEGGRLPVGILLYIVSQVLSALDFANSVLGPDKRPLSIVHRDISPSNILLSWNGEVKISDFGIAKGQHKTSQTVAGQFKGKYAYTSPEQARGFAASARSDIFSLGVVFFELATSGRLFDSKNDLEVIEKIKTFSVPIDRMRHLLPEVCSLILLSLANDPEYRYQSAKEMLHDLHEFVISSGNIATSLELAQFLKANFARLERAHANAGNFRQESTKTTHDPCRRISWAGKYSSRIGAGITLMAITFLPVRPLPMKTESVAPIPDNTSANMKLVRHEFANDEGEKSSSLSVNAKPWGIVDVSGVASNRETPFGSSRLKPGFYTVNVRHPPTGKYTSSRVELAAGYSMRCFADFSKKAKMYCK